MKPLVTEAGKETGRQVWGRASGQGVCTPAYSVGPGQDHGQDMGKDGQVGKNTEQAVNEVFL